MWASTRLLAARSLVGPRMLQAGSVRMAHVGRPTTGLLVGNVKIPKETDALNDLVERELKLRLKAEEDAKKSKKKVKPTRSKAAKLAAKRKWNIVKGDTVEFIGLGKENGKQGVVKQVIRSKEQVLVENLNIRRVEKFDDTTLQSYESHEEVPVHYSDVSLIDPVDGRPTRVRRMYLDDGTKVRTSTRSNKIIPYPKFTYVRDSSVHQLDTPADVVLKKTFVDK